jgi:hypothetical protein
MRWLLLLGCEPRKVVCAQWEQPLGHKPPLQRQRHERKNNNPTKAAAGHCWAASITCASLPTLMKWLLLPGWARHIVVSVTVVQGGNGYHGTTTPSPPKLIAKEPNRLLQHNRRHLCVVSHADEVAAAARLEDQVLHSLLVTTQLLPAGTQRTSSNRF